MAAIRKYLLPILEYTLLLTVILDCNSLYTSGKNDFSVDMTVYFTKTAIILGILIVILHLWKQPRLLRRLAGNFPVYAGFLVLCLLFYFPGVRAFDDAKRSAQYLRLFFLFLPVMTALFQIKRWEGQPFELLIRHSNMICIFGTANLLIYLVSVLRPDQLVPFTMRTGWNDMARLQEWSNFLNLLILRPHVRWQIVGAALPRNYGVFTEPLMYSIQLITALFTEMFLRERKDRYRVWRWVLYSGILLSAQATLGMILTAAAWGLKVMEAGFRKKQKRILLAGLALMLALGSFFVLNKKAVKFESTEVTGSSFSDHFDDYKYGLKAFLHKPLAGGGFQNIDYLHSFYSERRMKTNRGFSNSVAGVLGEGGILLGLVCMLPYLFFLLQLGSRKWKRIALWGMGPLGLYCLTIFHYRLYLLTVMAFGYSMLAIRRGKKLSLRIIWDEESVGEAVSDEEEGKDESCAAVWKWLTGRTFRIPMLVLAGMAAAVIFGKPLWDGMYHFLAGGRFVIGQSPVRTFWLQAALILHLLMAGWVLQGKMRMRYLAAAGVGDALFLLAYPWCSSALETVMKLRGTYTEIRACHLLLLAWAAAVVWVCLLTALPEMSGRGRIILVTASALLALTGLAGLRYADRKLDSRLEEIREGAEALKRVTAAASGRVYPGNLPLLYYRADPEADLSAANRNGLGSYENATVMFDWRLDVGEYFEAGFRMAEIADNCIIYTRDPAVIDALQKEGVTFYRYYPFTRSISLKQQAERNHLEPGEDGLLLTDEEHSMLAGPNDTLCKDRYTVDYSLHIDPADREKLEEDDVVCRLSVSRYAGDDVLMSKEITAGQFDENGDALAEVPFELDKVSDRVEYLAAASGKADVLLRKLEIRHTPDYITVTTRNAHQMPVREEYYTLDGGPYRMASGYAGVERTYNLADQAVAVKYLDDELEPAVMRKGYAEIRYRYNSRGRVSREAYFGPDGKPVVLRNGEAAVEKDYDAYGNVTVLRYLDADGKPTLLAGGYAEIHRTYNGKKQLIREEYYGTDGERITLPAGYTAFSKEYDEEGNLRQITYLDAADRPMRIPGGYARIRYTYNERGQVIREEYLGIDEERVLGSDGIAILEKEYDDAGNVCGERYFGTDEQPSPCNAGYMQLRREFNEKKQAVREMYYDADGGPASASNGCCGAALQYDALGNVSARTFLDADGEAMAPAGKTVMIRYEYDENRNVTAERYYDAQDKPVLNASGCAELRRVYNEKNKAAEEAYYDLEGNPCGRKDGVFARQKTYDEAGRVVSQVCIGEDGKPGPGSSGITEIRYAYDDLNCKVSEKYYDESGLPVTNTSGVHEIRYEYTERRQNAAEMYFGTDGTPAGGTERQSGILRTYYPDGNVETVTWADGEGHPFMNNNGYASCRREYDLYRNVIAEYYYDEAGDPVLNDSGYAEVHRVYGKDRKLLEEHCLDLQGNEVK